MTFWPDTRFDRISTDAQIADPAAYGIAPGPAGYGVADLRCLPTLQRHAQGLHAERCCARPVRHLRASQRQSRRHGRPRFARVRQQGRRVFLPASGSGGQSPYRCVFLRRAARAAGNRSRPRRAAVSGGVGSAFAPDPSSRRPVVEDCTGRGRQRRSGSRNRAHQPVCFRPFRRDRASDADTHGVLDAVRYINAHFAEHCPLDTLAAVAGMNRFRFAKRFRAVTGATANQYVISRRLSAAALRLAATKAPIAEIAFEVGFNDLSHFDACFRSAFGCAPSIWRRR